MRKKLYLSILAIVLVLSSFSGLSLAAADDEIGVILDGQAMVFDQNPTIVNNSTLVPMRAFFTALGASIEWDQSTKTVTSVRGEVTVTLTIDSKVA